MTRSVLWIAPQLPGVARDGGGKRIHEMLRVLRDHDHAVHVWARDAADSARDGPGLAALGITWSGSTLAVRTAWRQDAGDDLVQVLASRRWDVVAVSFARLAATVGSAVRRHAHGAVLLVDDADLHYLRRSRMPGASPRTGKREELAAYRRSDGVIVASDLEQRMLAAELPRTPTTVFTVAAGEPQPGGPVADRCDVLFVGALTHPPNVDAVTYWAREVAPALERSLGRPVALRVVGTGTEVLARDLDAAGARYVDVVGWAPDLAPAFARARVVVAPLRFGAGTKSKILDGLTFGVPTVTTGIGAEGFPGYIRRAMDVVDEPERFADAVGALLTDDARWEARRADVVAAASRSWSAQRERGAELVRWISERSPRRRARCPW